MDIETTMARVISDPATAEALWRIYEAGFEKSVEESVQDQLCYDRDTLAEALADQDYVKFVLKVDGSPAGFCLATNVPEKAHVAYVNPAYLRKRFAAEVAEGRLWYFTAITVLPHLQQRGIFFYAITEEVTRFIDACQGVVVVDHSLETSPHMPAMLQKAARKSQAACGLRTNDAEIETLGGQSYFALRLVRKP